MYKLTVVDGPNRGTSYVVQDGENVIGRQSGNAIVLQSAKVSKRHCVLVVNNTEIVLKDEGSANGTFVNGVPTKFRKVRAGDRIGVGEYVFQLVEAQFNQPKAALAVADFGNVLRFPAPQPQGNLPQHSQGQGHAGMSMSDIGSVPVQSPDVMPKDLKGKAIWLFEHRLMPFFYGLNLKYEWRLIMVGLLGAFVVGSLLVSVYPLLDSSNQAILKEMRRRAVFMAKQLAERNAGFFAANAETKTEVGSMENIDGVRLAAIVGLDSRIIAPARRLNEYLTDGPEGRFATQAARRFRTEDRERYLIYDSPSAVVAFEPVRVLNPSKGRNETVAMAIVSLDTAIATPDLGEMGMVYSQSLILMGVLAAFVFMVVYRLTLRPFQVLNDDMDKVLKGDMPEVTHEFKIEELNPLWDLINSALQRAARATAMQAGGDVAMDPTADDYVGPIRALGPMVRSGIVACDAERKIIFLNELFEEISGIRADSAFGQDFQSVSRDQALVAFTHDLFDRLTSGGAQANEDFDFSGISYKVMASAFGRPGASPKCYLLSFVRSEG